MFLDEGVTQACNNSHHSHTSVHKLGMGVDSNLLHIGHDSSKLGVSLNLPFVHRVVDIKKKGIREWKRGDGGGNSNEESVDIGDEDNGTLVANGVLSLF